MHVSEACFLQSTAHWNVAWLSWCWEEGPPADRQGFVSLVQQTMRWHVKSGHVCLRDLPDQESAVGLMYDKSPAEFVRTLMAQNRFSAYPLQKLHNGQWGRVLLQRSRMSTLNAFAQYQLDALDLPLQRGVHDARVVLLEFSTI